MKKYLIRINTLSDTMMGSGESVPGVIDSDIRHDRYGLPYMSAKTFKGLLHEQMDMLKCFDPEFENLRVEDLTGSNINDGETGGRLRFTNVALSSGLRNVIRKDIDAGKVTANEILNALTITYSFTKVDEKTGTAADHSLRTERMIRRGVEFVSELFLDDFGLSEETLETYDSFIRKSVAALQHIGTHKSKGKGSVRCTAEEVRS